MRDHVKAVGTSFDAEGMATEAVLTQLGETVKVMGQSIWDECYTVAVLFERDDWKMGINGTPNFNHFHIWYKNRDINQKRSIERKQLYKMNVVYCKYTDIADAKAAADMIKDMTGVEMAYEAMSWVTKYPERVLDILAWCQESDNARKLKWKLHDELPLRGSGDPSKRELAGGDDEKIDTKAIVEYFGDHPAEVVDDQMYVLRRYPRSIERELAWYAVTDVYFDRHPEADYDEVFSSMFDAWLVSLCDCDEVLKDAKQNWTPLVKKARGNPSKWPW